MESISELESYIADKGRGHRQYYMDLYETLKHGRVNEFDPIIQWVFCAGYKGCTDDVAAYFNRFPMVWKNGTQSFNSGIPVSQFFIDFLNTDFKHVQDIVEGNKEYFQKLSRAFTLLHSDEEEMCSMWLPSRVANAVNNCQLRYELFGYKQIFNGLAKSYDEFVSALCVLGRTYKSNYLLS